jgi:hypothetical protein
MKHLTIRSLTVALACSTFLAGCNSAALKDPSSPYAKVPIDTSLEIKQPITVPPGSTRVFVQLGKITRGFNRYAPNCNIEVAKIDWDNPQSIEPGVYRIARVQRSTEEVVEARTVMVASIGSQIAKGGPDDGGATLIYQGYHFWLDGPDPNVRRLSCRGAYADPANAQPPSINEIRQAIGDLMTLGSVEP